MISTLIYRRQFTRIVAHPQIRPIFEFSSEAFSLVSMFCATLEAVSVYRVVFEVPTGMATRIATQLADADGVELISSEPPSSVGVDTVRLRVAVNGELESVTDAIARIRGDIPTGASIEIVDD